MLSFKNNLIKLLILSLVAIAITYIGIASTKIIKWNLYPWLPEYWAHTLNQEKPLNSDERHIIFTMVDHYEPGFNREVAIENNMYWLDTYEPIAKRNRDSYGNLFQYTWFYAFDQANDKVMRRLSQSVFDGFGEIELHWHHPNLDNTNFDFELEKAINWFNLYGALTSTPFPYTPNFAFIHGNWALDASTDKCQVTEEISLLQKHGAYMDMTFSTIGVASQPTRFINQLYYVKDDPSKKSYEKGIEVTANSPVENNFLIFQGPLGFGWNLEIEYGAVESYSLPTAKRINKWIDANIHVKNKPNWTFIKVYSHGIQSIDIVENHLNQMLEDLTKIASQRNAKLHFMTAREAYNVVKAAEAGLDGDPEIYRDYLIKPPLNSVLPVNSIVTKNSIANDFYANLLPNEAIFSNSTD